MSDSRQDLEPHYMKSEHTLRLDGALKLGWSRKTDRALEICRSVLSEYPGDLLVMLKVADFMGQICRRGKRLDVMSEYCEQMLERHRTLVDAGDPPLPEVGLWMGDLCRRVGRKDLASEVYRRVADQYFDSGFDVRGVSVARYVMNLGEDCPDVRLWFGRVYFRMGLQDLALNSLIWAAQMLHSQELVDRDRRHAAVDDEKLCDRHEEISGFDTEPEVVISELRDFLKRSHFRPDLHLALVYLLKQQGNFEEALDSLLTVEELFRADGRPEAADLAQSLQAELESLVRASADPTVANVGQLRTLLVHSPNRADLHLCLGFALKYPGESDEAKESLLTAERLLRARNQNHIADHMWDCWHRWEAAAESASGDDPGPGESTGNEGESK